MTRHKHADVIIAWANGEDIEVKNPDGKWVTLGIQHPWWDANEYRIKPKTVKKEGWVARYRALLTSEDIYETEWECRDCCPGAEGYHRIEWEEEACR